MGSVSVFKWGEENTTYNPKECLPRSSEGGNRSNFPSHLEYQTMDKASNSECYTASSESFISYQVVSYLTASSRDGVHVPPGITIVS
jgi:hypothetical protein